MRLVQKATLLIAVPVVVELATVALLIAASLQLDEAGIRAMNAKRVLGLCQELQGKMGFRTMQLTGTLYSFAPSNKQSYIAEMGGTFSKLEQLTRNNPAASKAVERLHKSSIRFATGMEELAHGYSSKSGALALYRFSEASEFVESMSLTFLEMTRSLSELSDIYSKIERDFEPAAIQARTRLRNCITAVIIVNIVLVVALGYLSRKHMIARLKQLMSNIHTFGKSSASPARLSGDDELAELDAAFAAVWAERQKLDDIRKSMTAMVSHDLRIPLTSMNLTLDVIFDLESDTLRPDLLHKLKRLRFEVDRLRRLANTLLDIEKIESDELETKIEEVSLTTIVQTSIDSLKPFARSSNVTLEDNSDKASLLKCDEDRTIQVLINLLGNAIKFSPKGSTVTVSSDASDDHIRIRVADKGPGVPPDQQRLLFKKFSQLEQSAETKKLGTGLGLYICKMLITAQKGQIGFEPGEDKGSVFWFELPGKTSSDSPSEPISEWRLTR